MKQRNVGIPYVGRSFIKGKLRMNYQFLFVNTTLELGPSSLAQHHQRHTPPCC